MKIGYIGLGLMGGPLARNLIRAGKEVKVFDLNEESIKRTLAVGTTGVGVKSADELADCDVVFTSLPLPVHIKSTMIGENGLLNKMKEGSVYIDVSTIDPQTAQELEDFAAARGIGFMGCPLGKGPAQAEKAEQPIFAGGKKETFEKVKEALSLLDEGENSIRHNRSRDIPKLRLGASSTLTRYVLLSHLENYIARFPHVRITISCQSTYQTLQLLDEEKIDLGLIGRPQKLRGYYFQPLLKIQDTFVCTQQYLENQEKLYPDEPLIQAATFMMLDEDNITRQTVNTQLKEHHVELSHILEVTTMDLLIQFAEIGLGIACVIRDFVKKELEKGTLVEVPVGFSFPLREIGFVCRQKDADSALIAPFFDDETEHPDK